MRYGQRRVFDALDVDVQGGSLRAIVGPNGAGKSSLLRVLAGVQTPSAGSVTRAKRISLISPSSRLPADVTPRELAGYGPALHRPWWRLGVPDEERALVDAALARVGLSDRADDAAADLSDGEVQRAWLAAALATSPSAVLIDEPTTHLDLRYQIEVMTMLCELARGGIAIVTAIHDLTLAARFADSISLLAAGFIVTGAPEAVLDATALTRAFGVRITTHRDPIGGFIVCLAG